jgi:thioredoxin 1
MLPLVREIAAAHGIQLHEYDRDECGALARAYGVMGVPCLIVMENGAPGDRIVGLVSRARIEGLIAG